MRKTIIIITTLFILNTTMLPAMSAKVYFSPRGGCLRAIIREIYRARKTIKILAYRFTSWKIIKALKKAVRRGVKVQAVLDGRRTSNEYSKHRQLKQIGVKVYRDYSVYHMHDKVMLVDGYITLTGSYNFTTLAERGNSENVIVIRSRYVYRRYLAHFYKRKSKSRRY